MRNTFYQYLLLLILFSFSVVTPSVAYAQSLNGTATPEAEEEKPAPKSSVPDAQSTPRRVLIAFIDRMSRDDKKGAAELLDLSKLSPEAASAKGPELAYKLYATMQRVADLPITKISEGTEIGELLAEVPSKSDYEGRWTLDKLEKSEFKTGLSKKEAELIEIDRSEKGYWRFSSSTVGKIEEIFLATENKPKQNFSVSKENEPTKPFSVWYRELFPQLMHEPILGMPAYQWLSLLVVTLVCLIIKRLIQRVLTWMTDGFIHRYDPDFPGSTAAVWKPVGSLMLTAVLYYASKFIGLPLAIIGYLLILLKIVTIAAAVLATYRFADLIGQYLTRRAKRHESRYDELAVPLSTTTVKIFATIAGLLATTETFNPGLTTTVIGGLGIGGIAIALASQETLSNFIGSLAVIFDRPFVAGDWVIVDGIEGEVEEVGFRSTKIRTALSSQVSIPNSKLASTNIDNMGRRRYRRYLTKIGVEYDTTTERIEAFAEGIQELIRRQPHTRKDFFAAYFNDFGDSALELILVCYFEVPDWATELRERQRLLLDIVRLAEQLEIAFAFPTQTVHMRQEQAKRPRPTLEKPVDSGVESAAEIAGELLNYQDRPTKVNFPGPTHKIAAKSPPQGG